jgi:hypothetical protein
VLLSAVLVASCGDKQGAQDILGALPGARVKFFNFAVNGPGVNFYANDQKMTAITSATGTESTVGTNYSGVGSGGFYSAINPGQYTFTGRIAAATDKDLAIASAAATLAEGKSYSFYLSGFYDAATKKADAFVVEDDFPAEIDYSAFYVRFVNAVSNSQPMSLGFRVPINGTTGQVGTVVAYKGASAFVRFTGTGVVDLFTRTAGGTTDVITRSAVSLVAGRVYTVTARGDMTVTSTTATNRPFLDLTANR